MQLSIHAHIRAVILQFAMSFVISGPINTIANLKHAALILSNKTTRGLPRSPKLFLSVIAAYSPKLFLTSALTLLSNSDLLSLHILAASTLAGLSSFGSAIMLMTLIKIFSTLWIGLQRSEACS